MKSSKILMISAITVIFFSLLTLSYQSKIFADTVPPCCENQQCESTAQQGVHCNSQSSMQLKPLCNDITLTCKDCVDYTISGCLCGSGSSYCSNSDGSIYYGSYKSDCYSTK
jgi:hypothetical protein